MGKPHGPRFADIGQHTEERPYDVTGEHSQHGKTTLDIACPFCDATVTAYVWSLSGGGKRCPCGALFGKFGTAYHWKPFEHPQVLH